MKSNEFWRAALIRAARTVAQTLVGTFPAGAVVTVQMIQDMDISCLWAILAWLCSGLLSGVMSILTSVATGLPEADSTEHIPATVYAYDDYDEDGSPIVKGGEGDGNN